MNEIVLVNDTLANAYVSQRSAGSLSHTLQEGDLRLEFKARREAFWYEQFAGAVKERDFRQVAEAFRGINRRTTIRRVISAAYKRVAGSVRPLAGKQTRPSRRRRG